jgi:hypothetical protein
VVLSGRRVALVFFLFLVSLGETRLRDVSGLVASQSVAKYDPVASSHVLAVAATPRAYLPVVSRAPACQPVPGASYITLPPESPPSDRPAEAHPDLNLSMRDYQVTDAPKALVDYGSPGHDRMSPQLSGLFGVPRLPVFRNVYRVYDWDWPRMQRGALLSLPLVTAVGMETYAGEILHVPASDYDIGSDCEALVLYASADRITLKYTREDNVVSGYTLHVESLCVDPGLLALYQQCNSAGRRTLPALRAGQAFGRARGGEVVVAIRDTGTFMDPRARGDWWLGY